MFVTPLGHSIFGTFTHFLIRLHQYKYEFFVFLEALIDRSILLRVSCAKISFALNVVDSSVKFVHKVWGVLSFDPVVNLARLVAKAKWL